MAKRRKSTRKVVFSNPDPMSAGLEMLESRQLLSVTLHPNITVMPATTGPVVQGNSPSEIRHAYGFDQVHGNGAGQTVAIVDAFNDPNIVSDLSTFDQQYGLGAPPSLQVVNQTGGSVTGIRTNSGWSTEIALDVEWAHAIAPAANILLVEANSASLGNLMSAVDYARHAVGVSVVSMSWGASEFPSETRYDSLFTTPPGHNGVTFVTASGDSGSSFGPEWPASSPNVLSVGGTTLTTTDAAGTYGSETGWSGSGGGISSYENQPAYQANAQGTGARTSPDVAYNADPNSGFIVYSSIPDQGSVGWSVVGGTSAGSPQWAALLAIANELRVAGGMSTLDGATGTLPLLYSLYSAPGTAGYASYTANFNDIATGQSSIFLSAHPGYDGVTGLGTPKAPQVIAALAAKAAPAPATVPVTASVQVNATTVVRRRAKSAPVDETESPVADNPALVQSATVLDAANSRLNDASVLTADNLAPSAPVSVAVSAPVPFAIDRRVSRPQSETLVASKPFTGVASALPRTFSSEQRILSPSWTRARGTVDEAATDRSMPFVQSIVLPMPQQGQARAVAAPSEILDDLTYEPASVGSGASRAVATEVKRDRLWATLTIVAVDAILIGYWHLRRRKRQPGHPTLEQSPFSLREIKP